MMDHLYPEASRDWRIVQSAKVDADRLRGEKRELLAALVELDEAIAEVNIPSDAILIRVVKARARASAVIKKIAKDRHPPGLGPR